MGVQNLQKFIEAGHVEGGLVPVELLRIAHNFYKLNSKIKGDPYRQKLSLLLDADSCLNRLYGGYFSDWICGGQWNRMFQYVSDLIMTCQEGNIELTVAFNGAYEPERMKEFINKQVVTKTKVDLVFQHIRNKGTPPPKVWWTPPPCLTTALRLAFRYYNVPVICTINNHHQEVMTYCYENNIHGIIADDAEYIVFNPPRYFSAADLKLTYKGLLKTKEFVISQLTKSLDLTTENLCILATLLGNHILTKQQLKDFHASITVNPNKDTLDVTIRGVAAYVKTLKKTGDINDLAAHIFPEEDDEKRKAFIKSVQYYLSGTKEGYLTTLKNENSGERNDETKMKNGNGNNNVPSGTIENNTSLPSKPVEAKTLENGQEVIAGLKNMIRIPPIPPDVLRTAWERHQKGLMSPQIYHLLTKGQVTLPVLTQKAAVGSGSIHCIYKPIRENVYAILLNLHHQLYVAKQEVKKDAMLEMCVAEWDICKEAYNRQNFPFTVKYSPVVALAKAVRWHVPTVQRLWFGKNDMRQRLRAYLTCMKSDSRLMVCSSYVPQHLLLMASVLRYLMQFNSTVLTLAELDAFIVTAFSPDLMNAEYIEDLQLQVVSSRAVILGNLFMQGVETALLVNDACGAPIPWLKCCPWFFFDGKLFHSILSRVERVKSLQELCDHRLDILAKVERMRAAILENIHFGIGKPSHILSSKFHKSSAGLKDGDNDWKGFGSVVYSVGDDPTLDMVGRNNPRGLPRRPIPSRGGQLEIAGVVVGNWGPNHSLGIGNIPPPPPHRIVGGFRHCNRNILFNERHRGANLAVLRKTRLGVNTKKNKTKKVEKKKETKRVGVYDTSTNVNDVGDTLGTTNSEETGEHIGDPVVNDVENKVAALSLERGQGDHSLE